jgi:chromate reductase, NAD(P)H dehydrogenase (quinone)
MVTMVPKAALKSRSVKRGLNVLYRILSSVRLGDEESRMSAHDKGFHLLGLSGSIRRGSHNTIILRTLAERLDDGVSLAVLPLDEVPLYNSDLAGKHLPDPVWALRNALVQSDGIVLCSPEYNHGMSGVLKNALDWASRPASNSPLKNKAYLAMTSSPGYVGAARAHAQVQETLSSALARVVVRPQVVIASVMQKNAGGRLVDENTIRFCLEAIDDLLKEIRLLSLQTG